MYFYIYYMYMTVLVTSFNGEWFSGRMISLLWKIVSQIEFGRGRLAIPAFKLYFTLNSGFKNYLFKNFSFSFDFFDSFQHHWFSCSIVL